MATSHKHSPTPLWLLFSGSGHPAGPAWSMTSPSRRLCSSAAAAFRLRWQRWTRSTCQGHKCCHPPWNCNTNIQRQVAPLCLDLIPLWIRLKKTRRFDFYIVIFWYCWYILGLSLPQTPSSLRELPHLLETVPGIFKILSSVWKSHIWVSLLRLDGINVLGKLRADAAGWLKVEHQW